MGFSGESRKTSRYRLIAIGAFEVGLAAIPSFFAMTWLLTLLSPWSLVWADQQRIATAEALFCICVAVIFGTVGAATASARRWALPLTIALSCVWLAIGVHSCLLNGVLADWAAKERDFDAFLAQAGRPPALGSPRHMLYAHLAMLLLQVAIPVALLLLMRSPRTRHAFELLDLNMECWTDACPTPFLTQAAGLMMGGLYFLNFSIFVGGVPVFGFFVRGWTAVAVCFLLTLALLLLALGVTQVPRPAWWATLALFSVIALSVWFSLNGVTADAYYRLLAYGQAAIAQDIEAGYRLYQQRYLRYLAPIICAIAYLAYTRRFLEQPPELANDSR